MWIKLCANTSLNDALAGAAAGADALGFVFARSPRQVDSGQVRNIRAHLPATVETVGVFLQQNPSAIAAAAAEANLRTVQLHGGLDLAFAAELRGLLDPRIAILHTTHWSLEDEAASSTRISAALEQLATLPGPQRLLVDAQVGAASGGLGVSFNWEAAQPVFAHGRAVGVRMILAGGLAPENVAEAIHTLAPWGVDVASGVERAPGQKDHARLRAFVADARAAGSAEPPHASVE